MPEQSSIPIPGYRAATWQIDPVHPLVAFTVRHMMISRFRGHFTTFGGTIVTAKDPLASSVTAHVDMASIDTRNEDRDKHVRSADFLDVERYPEMSYRSVSMAFRGDDWLISGELTLHGVTRPVPLVLEPLGFTSDSRGPRAGFSASAEINRRDFVIDITLPMAAGGVMVGDKVWKSRR
ncbi:YceI family protein [Actinomadura macra]|uniref:YceI family protein n=1 Tax=Actinomadura macra TaxID=46164 RepID=UPI0008378BAB|nr:YceI family protein [Actinomadura macra]